MKDLCGVFMNNNNVALSVLSLFIATTSMCMLEQVTGVPSPSLYTLASQQVLRQIKAYIKDAARQMTIDPVVAANELLSRIPEYYFDIDGIKGRLLDTYAEKQFERTGNGENRTVRFFDGRQFNLKQLHLATPTFKRQVKEQSPLRTMTSRDFIALIVRVKRAKQMNLEYPH